MNKDFIQTVESSGEAGKEWLAKIPGIITSSEKRWGLKVLPPFKLNYNYVAPAQREDGSRVVLKIGFTDDPEFKTEIEALGVFNGEGIAKLLEVDRENWAILIEQVTPGVPLSTIKDDAEATKILASVIKRLPKPLLENNGFITISDWMKAIPEYRAKHPGSSGPLSATLVEKAEKLFDELIATSEEPMLVHGDLHQDNILSSDRDGWLAIDPKGIAAERAYETAAMIRNPYEMMKDVPDIKDVLTRRITILSEELQLDPTRILKWALAQTVLSAVWNVESTKGPEHAIMVAEVLDTITL